MAAAAASPAEQKVRVKASSAGLLCLAWIPPANRPCVFCFSKEDHCADLCPCDSKVCLADAQRFAAAAANNGCTECASLVHTIQTCPHLNHQNQEQNAADQKQTAAK
jgi:hypothetical protein